MVLDRPRSQIPPSITLASYPSRSRHKDISAPYQPPAGRRPPGGSGTKRDGSEFIDIQIEACREAAFRFGSEVVATLVEPLSTPL